MRAFEDEWSGWFMFMKARARWIDIILGSLTFVAAIEWKNSTFEAMRSLERNPCWVSSMKIIVYGNNLVLLLWCWSAA